MMLERGGIRDVEVIKLSEAEFALSKHDKFACADPAKSEIPFDRSSIGPWETFRIAPEDGVPHIRGRHFPVVPTTSSSDATQASVEVLAEELAAPRVSDEDLCWFEQSPERSINVTSGKHLFSASVHHIACKYMSVQFYSHGVLFDEMGFLQRNFGFIFLNRRPYKALLINPVNAQVRLATDIAATLPVIRGEVILPFDGNSHNYYHFCLDGLINLFRLRRLGFQAPAVVCVDGALQSWQSEYFALMREEDCIIIDGNSQELVKVESAYYVQDASLELVPQSALRSFSLEMKKACDVESDAPSSKKLYITRHCGPRMLSNREQAEILFEKRGFEIIDLNMISVEDQIRLFSSAELVVSAHGAGLTNIIYCSPGSKVIELIPDCGPIRNYFWLLASKMGLSYSFLRCRAKDGYDGVLDVDLDSLQAILN